MINVFMSHWNYEVYMKVVVAIEDVRKMTNFRQKVNSFDFDDIIWTEDGRVVEFPEHDIEEHKFSGLNNLDFISVYS